MNKKKEKKIGKKYKVQNSKSTFHGIKNKIKLNNVKNTKKKKGKK